MIVNQLIIKLKDTIVMEITKNKVTTKKWNTEECSNRIDLQRFHLSCRLFPTPP